MSTTGYAYALFETNRKGTFAKRLEEKDAKVRELQR
jgi:hypothetical protein